MTFRQLLRLLVLGVGILSAEVFAADKFIRHGFTPDGFPPFMILEPSKPATGLMVEVLRLIALNSGYRVEEKEAPRRRLEDMVLRGELETVALAKEWVSTPEKFIFTDPVLRVRDVVFSLKKNAFSFESPKSLFGKTIGTHMGYAYPSLDAYVVLGKISRDDAPSDRAMLDKLLFERNEVAIVNERVGLWLIKTEGWSNKFVYSKNEVGGYDYRFMFNNDQQPFVTLFNRELAKMKKDGRLEKLIAKYRPEGAVEQR